MQLLFTPNSSLDSEEKIDFPEISSNMMHKMLLSTYFTR